MASVIITKNSSTAASVPTNGQLVQGELAVNVVDGFLFTEDNANSVVQLGVIKQGGTANDTAHFDGTNWLFSNALQNDGTNLSASGTLTVTGLVSSTAGFSGPGSSLTGVDAATLDGLDSPAFLRSDVADTAAGVLTYTASPVLNDSVKLSLGTGSDTELYNDGTNTYLDLQASGNVNGLYIRNGTTQIAALDRVTGNLVLAGNVTADRVTATGDLYNQGGQLCTNFERFITLTQTAYDALTPDADTIYFINGV